MKTTKDDRPPCQACGGSGQLSFFKGVSRFLLSVEECPECAGLGYVVVDERPSAKPASRKRYLDNILTRPKKK